MFGFGFGFVLFCSGFLYFGYQSLIKYLFLSIFKHFLLIYTWSFYSLNTAFPTAEILILIKSKLLSKKKKGNVQESGTDLHLAVSIEWL